MMLMTSIDEILRSAPQWNSLKTSLDLPMGEFEWLLSSFENLSSGKKPYLEYTTEDDKIMALAPLVKAPGFFSPLELIGSGEHGEPIDFCYANSKALRELVSDLSNNNRPLLLNRVPLTSPLHSAIKKSYKGKGIVYVSKEQTCPFIEISKEDPLSSSLKRDLRRAQRKADAMGEVDFELHTPDSEKEFNPLWDQCLEIESANWKGECESSLKKDQIIGSFYKTFALKAAKSGSLKIGLLKISGKAVAMQIALERGKRFWLLKIGYNENYRNCSPGQILMNHTFQYAFDKKLRSYEFLGNPSAWTKRWTKNERDNLRIKVYPYSLRGMGLFAIDGFKFLAGKLRDARNKNAKSTKK
jgi:hypothetical protein